MAGDREDMASGTPPAKEPEMLQRESLCFSSPIPGTVIHNGDEGFREAVHKNYSIRENNATEQLVQLKTKLKGATTSIFWTLLMEGMTKIVGAQYGFVIKRILVDNQDSAVEMPRIGEVGSCLLAVAFYYNDGQEIEAHHRDYKYLAYGAPCEYMKHDKVFLVPSGLLAFVPHNPNPLAFPCDSYLGLPLFEDGKCFAHFGAMWTAEAVQDMGLSWAYIEVLLHSLEDMIIQRLLEGQSFAKPTSIRKTAQVIPQDAITAAQSLKPYARSLSHELRTPMQGVVGMLDVMYATVQESIEEQSDDNVRKTFQTLRDNIESAQDSSRRAVEAADNVVHAYDLNMEVPDSRTPSAYDESGSIQPAAGDRRPNILIEGSNIPIKRGKRRGSDSFEWVEGPIVKRLLTESQGSSPQRDISLDTSSLPSAVGKGGEPISASSAANTGWTRMGVRPNSPKTPDIESKFDQSGIDSMVTPGLRHTKVRDLLYLLVHESLRTGDRPESAITKDTAYGEIIEVRTRTSIGIVCTKTVELSVDPSIPETIFVDERGLCKLVSCVFLNAIKFTEQGKISLTVSLSPKSRYMMINIKDSGPGIPDAFLPYLFKPFSREDDSLTRQTEGLGLGLLVAKGLARKIGGDLVCLRSDTEGPQRGTEFQVRIPLSSDSNSRASSPSRTPTPPRLSLERPHSSSPSRNPRSAVESERALVNSGIPISRTSEPLNLNTAPFPLRSPSSSRRNSLSRPRSMSKQRSSTRKRPAFDKYLAKKYPLTFLVAEDNKINRKLLVNMLSKLGYTNIYEAYDGAEAVRQMSINRASRGEQEVDVILMDLWMPNMDGYEATERILAMDKITRACRSFNDEVDSQVSNQHGITILAVSADITTAALERAKDVGMEGFMTKPYKLLDLERLIVEYCTINTGD